MMNVNEFYQYWNEILNFDKKNSIDWSKFVWIYLIEILFLFLFFFREIKKQIRIENERVEYLAGSKEFNLEHCIRCFKSFRFLFNPRESCSECKLFVCHDCSTYTKENKTWACKSCLKLK
jgi:hypothetical protein